MSEFGKKLKRIAELGEEMGAIISADWDMISVSSDWREDGSETVVLHVCVDKYEALKAEYQLDWKLETVTTVCYRFTADFEGIKLLMLFSDAELPEELKGQVEERKKALSEERAKRKKTLSAETSNN